MASGESGGKEMGDVVAALPSAGDHFKLASESGFSYNFPLLP
jgi:hypothetical protein